MASQHSLQRLMRLARYAVMATAILLLQLPATVRAQEPRLTKTNIVDSLKNGARRRAERMSGKEYVEWIEQRGVDFQITPADEQEIRKAGSYLTPAQLSELIAAARANYRPEPTSLSGNIDQVEVAPNPAGGVRVFLHLSIRNLGPPTTVQKYHLEIKHQTSKSIDFKSRPLALSERYSLPQGSGAEELVIQPQDAIELKTSRSLPRGVTVHGWLRFALPLPLLTPEYMRQSGIRYALSFVDATGKSYTAAYETP